MRRPKTKAEFAKQIGVVTPTLYRWDKDPNLVMAVRWLAIQNAGDVGRISNVVSFLYDTTMDKDLGHRIRLDAARDFLKAIGVAEVHKFDNKLLQIDDVGELDLDSLSDEEIWELQNERARQAGLDELGPFPDDTETIDAEVVDDEGQVLEDE